MARPPFAVPGIRLAGTAALAALLLASMLPLPAAGVGRPVPAQAVATTDAAPDEPITPTDDPSTLGPSTVYEQAMEHAADVIEFTPGGRVTTGFAPLAADRWPVDGAIPVALPAGRATGAQMAASAQGSTWTEIGGIATDPSATGSATGSVTAGGVDRTATTVVAPAAATGLRRQVFGFLPYWELSGASTRLNFDVLSTVAYFSVGADAKGNLRKKDADGTSTTGWGGWTSSSMTSVINAAHDRGTRVVLTISVFAWTSAQAGIQSSLLASPTARQNFARQAAAAVRDRGADGINLDFEPIASGHGSDFLALLKAVRAELSAIKPGYQLTYDTTGYIGNYPIEASVAGGAADAIFVMGYDYRTGSASTAGSTDPLTGTGYDLTDTVRAYTSRVPASKVILGLPWYGRAWSTASDAVRSTNTSGAKYGYSTAVNYENVVGLVSQYGSRWDAAEQSPYVVYRRENCTTTYGCVTSWRQVYYDDAASTKARLAMVNDYGLRGAGVWALGYDGGHAELYRAFAESFLVDKSAPQAGVRWMVAAQPDEGFTVTWAASDASAIANYDVQVSVDGGAWTDWLISTTATSDIYLGADGHGYAFRVRARDAKGNAGTWNVGQTWTDTLALKTGAFGRVTKDGLAYRTGPSTSAGLLGTLPKGTIVALTRGPVTADGYTWYEVTQPIHEWSPVGFVERGVWIAVASDTATYVNAYRAPNSTTIDAGIRGLEFGSGEAAPLTVSGASDPRSFSPDGDGSGDHVVLRWTNAVAMDSMTLKVYRTTGTLVGSVTMPAAATVAGARTWSWDGKVAGVAVADGRYVLQLVGTAGTVTYTAPSVRPVTASQVAAYAITADTADPTVKTSSAPGAWLSPNADGIADSIKAALAATGASRWSVQVASPAGAIVRTITGSGSSTTFTWTGTDDAGKALQDGRYAITVAAWDAAGNHVARTWHVTLDTLAPAVAPSVSASIFAPNGDGAADTSTLGLTSTEPATGTARIYRGTTLVRSWPVTAATAWSVAWTGRTASGAAVADGTYTFKADLRDAAGNRRTASTSIVVDRTAGFLRWSGNLFPQDADTLLPTSRMSYTLTRNATTTLRLFDAAGTLVRTVWTNKAQSAGTRTWTWDGRLADGTYVPQGRYTASLTVTSSLGTQVLTRAVVAAAFSVHPSATTVKAGQTLVVSFTTVEPLSIRPTVTFTQPGRAGVTVTASRLADGSYRASFKVAAGTAGAATVRISAKDSSGHRNTTTVGITVAS